MRIYYKYLAVLVLTFLFGACSDQEYDDYKKFTKGGEINYTEKIDSVKAFPGKNRIKLQGIIDADPRIVELRAYWNAREDSLSVPITRSPHADTIEFIVDDIPENIYNFELQTFDKQNNSSLVSSITAAVYGERYQNTLFNRPVISNTLVGTNLTVNYASMDLSTGVIGTEIEYTSVASELEEAFVPIDSSSVSIEGFRSGSEYKYRTVFLPEPTSIDTFYTDYASFTPDPKVTDPPYFKNASAPYELSSQGSRWGTPADWIHNDAALNHNDDGQQGAYDGNSKLWDLESGYGQPNIVNGKVYQVFILPAGDYVYNIDIAETNYEGADSDKDQAYFTVASGSTLPDVAVVDGSPETIAFERINKANGLNRSVVFSVDQTTQVAIGVETTNKDGVGRYLKINSFSLNEIAGAPYLKNASAPYDLASKGSRWGTPADWIHNEAALSHDDGGPQGAYDGNSQRWDLESGYGQPNIVNGKVYQNLVLRPGTYTYQINIYASNYKGARGDTDHAYFIVAKGGTLPDVADAETSSETLAYNRVDIDNGKNISMTFTLDEITQVSIGGETTNKDGAGLYLQIDSFKLEKM